MSAIARSLIVNADDFGLSPGVNAGVVRALEAGIVTSASLMVRALCAADAAELWRRHPHLSLGLHIDLGEWTRDATGWRPVYSFADVDDADAVRHETSRQLMRFRELTARNPTHLDSHQHVHRKEPVRSVLVEMANALEVPLRHESPHVRYCGDFYGQSEDGTSYPEWIRAERLVTLVASLRPGTTELCCHPSSADDVDTLYRSERLMELEALCDPRVRAALRAQDIRLCSFSDVPVAS